VSAAVDTTTRSIPYAGASSPIPRTTAEERAAITHLAAIAHLDLLSYEPEHALLERNAHRAAQYRNRIDPQPHKAVGENPGGLRVTASEWRARWRSLPDYDGPPMRAPSGFVVRFPAVEAAEPFGAGVERDKLHRHLRLLGGEKVRSRRNDTVDAVREYGMAGALSYEQPPRGRGWCPKLAGVQS